MIVQAYSISQVEALLRHLIEYTNKFGSLEGLSDKKIIKLWEEWCDIMEVADKISFPEYLHNNN